MTRRTITRSTVFSLLLACVLLASCATVPITGRKQLSLISDAEMNAMSFQQYEQVIAESQLSTDAEATAMVKRVGERIQGAVEKYFRDNGMSAHLEGYAWEFAAGDQFGERHPLNRFPGIPGDIPGLHLLQPAQAALPGDIPSRLRRP